MTQRDALRLANLRYEGGVSSFLEVLITERDLFEFELVLARVQRDELLAVVQLYRALGGGWQAEVAPARPGGHSGAPRASREPPRQGNRGRGSYGGWLLQWNGLSLSLEKAAPAERANHEP